MFLQILIALPLYFSRPDIIVKWLPPKSVAVNIKVTGTDPLLEGCLNSGSILRYVYQAQICKRRPTWFDNCQPPRELVRQVQYDPIIRSYTVSSNWTSRVAAEERDFSDKSEMLDYLRTYPDLQLSFLAYDVSEYVNSKRSYIALRVTSECQGQYNQTLAMISKILSFGLAEKHEFDTGWIDFKLRNNQ